MLRKYDPAYKQKVKQIVGVIDEKLAKRAEFGGADVNRHLEFDCTKHLRVLVRHQHLAEVGKGVFERADWPLAGLLEGEPIGITYCIQTWFRYYLR